MTGGGAAQREREGGGAVFDGRLCGQRRGRYDRQPSCTNWRQRERRGGGLEAERLPALRGLADLDGRLHDGVAEGGGGGD